MAANKTLEEICAAAKEPQAFIDACEKRYANKIRTIAQEIVSSNRTEIVMIAGPSSSGKTTSAKKLAQMIEKMGGKSYTISLDDFYLNNDDAPRFPDGSPDFETVYALDIPYFQQCMQSLLDNNCAELPEFDFKNGRRCEQYRRLEIAPTDVIIVEGLHALNPVITESLPPERLLKIYINVSSRIYNRKGDLILNKRTLRFVRRLVRDYNSRGNSVEETFKLWVGVRYGEDTYLFPYKDNADIRINTIHHYESCVLRDMAIPLLAEVPRTSPNYRECQRLIQHLRLFPAIDPDLVPDDSMMREFIGKKQ